MKKNGPEESCGARRIMTERQRQLDKEGWDAEHDDGHRERELVFAAICYAAPGEVYLRTDLDNGVSFHDPWPDSWDDEWDKRHYKKNGDLTKATDLDVKKQIRNLEKAGALIAAEIDRLLRSSEK